MRLYLTPHVRACVIEGHLVFLDIENDRYFSLDPSHTSETCSLLGLGVGARKHERSNESRLSPRGHSTIRTLLRHHIVTTAPVGSEDGIALGIDVVPATLAVEKSGPVAPLNIGTAFRFFAAGRHAGRLLKFSPFAQIVNQLSRRKAGLKKCSTDGETVNTSSLVRLFLRLRPLYPRPYLCLFDSLAMIEFLSLFGHFPTWVFGVAVNPFRAHCWVQEGRLLLNDDITTTSRYTPIITV